MVIDPMLQRVARPYYGHQVCYKLSYLSSIYTVSDNFSKSFFGVQDPAIHKFLRGRVIGAYSLSSVLAMESDIQQLAEKCWSKLREHAKSGEAVEISQWASYFTFDVISELGMGGALGFLDKGGDVDEVIDSVHGGSGVSFNKPFLSC